MTTDDILTGTLVSYLLIWILFGIVTGMVMSNRNRSTGAGFLLGLFLGPFGLIIALLTKEEVAPAQRTRECPHCREPMRRDASTCPHCQKDSEPWTFHEGHWWAKTKAGMYYLDEDKNEWMKSEATPQI